MKEKTLLCSAVALTTLGIFLLCVAKYARYGYNAIDLAYFNQVFWNTVRGGLFEQSIHPHLSLGDHAELLIPLLAPLYSLWQDPRLLLLLQAAILTFCAWPIWLLVRERRASAGTTVNAPVTESSLVPFAFAIAWLLNPLMHNIALFEFHILPFAIFPLLMALRAYRRDDRRGFLLWSVAALLAREDVALVVLTLPMLAWLEKRSRWWLIAPLALGSAWFVGAMMLIRVFAPEGGYKFAIYYSWLGDALAHPSEVIAHLLTLGNLEMLLGFLMATAFLPLFGWRPLVLALAPLAQIMLGAPGGSSVVLETHYASLFLPALVLASIDGYAALLTAIARRPDKTWLGITLRENEGQAALPLLCFGIVLYSAVALGPVPASLARAVLPRPAAAVAADAIVAAVPSDAAIAASYALLPHLSSRERVYSAHYLFLGVTQFGERPYSVPSDLRYTAFDDRDLAFYAAQFPRTAWAAPYYADGLSRLRAAIGVAYMRRGSVALYERSGPEASGMDETVVRPVGLPLKMPDIEAGTLLILDGDRSIKLSD